MTVVVIIKEFVIAHFCAEAAKSWSVSNLVL